MATSTRESRRRKILERGSDRLAFIMGQVQNLPTHSPDGTDTDPPPPLVPQDQDPTPSFSSQAPVSPNDANDKASGPVLLKHDPNVDADLSQTSSYDGGIGEGSISDLGGTRIEPPEDPALDASGKANSLPVSSADQSSFISTSRAVQHSETLIQQHNYFTPKQMSSAIDSSEKTRRLCSVIVAILVVLSHLGFRHLGNRFLGSIISFRPLYFILLTNLTMVIARLLFHDHEGRERAIGDENENASEDEYNLTEQLSKTLEVGLATQKMIDAAFMDCSIYAIIVICGLSFA